MSDLKLPDISDEDKQNIADIEAELKDIYDEEADVMAKLKAAKIDANTRHREAVATAHQNRMDVINADPELKALHQKLAQNTAEGSN